MDQLFPEHWLDVSEKAATIQSLHSVQSLVSFLARFSPAQYCQAIFILLAATAWAVNVLPARSRRLFTNYGARDMPADSRPGQTTGDAKKANKDKAGNADTTDMTQEPAAEPAANPLDRFLEAVAARTMVPHNWFTSFYAAYIVLALAWATQWWLWRRGDARGDLFGWLVTQQKEHQAANGAASSTFAQVCLVFGLEVLQASRRLYEHLAVFKPSSKSKMNVSHWLLGTGYYIVMSVTVWIEGAQAIVANKDGQLWPPVPSSNAEVVKSCVGTFLFAFAWINQFECHVYLASLKKYSLPQADLFRYLVCPHYTCECILYVSLSIIAAPPGQLFNRTLLCSVTFVISCLGVSAYRTKEWYISTFGEEQVAKKWRMIPFVF